MTLAARLLPLHRPSSEPTAIALFSKGFRPFFLLAAAFAALSVPAWLLALRGGFPPGGSFGAMQWHAHEMLFGFSVAVIAGFLLTAVANWTERETAVGLPLFALSTLWLLGRVGLFFAGSLPRLVPSLVDLAFLPALAVVCARPIVASRNLRNYPFVALLLLLALTNAAAHFGALRQDLVWVRGAHRVALDIVLLMVLIVTGRVVPMFTRNATQSPGLRAWPLFERSAAVSLALLLLADGLGLGEQMSAPLAALAGAFCLLRMRYWGTLRSLGEPLLWVLHCGALWLPIGLLLRGASAYWSLIPQGSAVHALTAGAVGTLTLGMMARVSLGHTGRALRVPWPVATAFGLIAAAALLRVAGPFLPAAWYFPALVGSGTLWSFAFATFFIAYAKILTSRRADAPN